MTTQSSMNDCVRRGHSAHDSTTCNNGKSSSFKLFGVTIDPKADQTKTKEKEKENYYQLNADQSKGKEIVDDGYHHRRINGVGNLLRKCKSVELFRSCESNSTDRDYSLAYTPDLSLNNKKGVPWTKDEHMSFLMGLEKLGRGDWRGISKNYVPTRTPTQVASHAQKYYIRKKSNHEKRKRRSSLFDMLINNQTTEPSTPHTGSDKVPPLPMPQTLGVQGYSQTVPFKQMVYPSSSRNKHGSGDPKFSSLANYPNYTPNRCWDERFGG